MRRFHWDKKYLHWGVTAFLVIAASILFYMLVTNLDWLGSALHRLGSILSPFVWGLVIAYLLYPLMKIYQRSLFRPLWKLLLRRRPDPEAAAAKPARVCGVFLAIVSLFVIVGGLIWLVAPQLYSSLENIVVNSPTYVDQMDAWINRLFANYPEIEAAVGGMFGDISDGVLTWASNNLLPELKGVIANLTNGVYVFAKGIYNVIIGIIVSVYVLYNQETFGAHGKKILYSIFSLEAAQKILNALEFTNDVFMRFISGKILDSLLIGMICYIGCSVLFIPYALLVSFFVGITNIIPFFGPFIGAIPSALIILTVSPMKALFFVIFIILLQQFDGNFLGPKILGSRVGINGFWIMFSIILGAGLFGFAGMLLGVPVFVVIYTFFKGLVNRKLRRSGLPAETGEYVDIRSIDPATQQPIRREEPKKEPAPRRRRWGKAKKEAAGSAAPSEETPSEDRSDPNGGVPPRS